VTPATAIPDLENFPRESFELIVSVYFFLVRKIRFQLLYVLLVVVMRGAHSPLCSHGLSELQNGQLSNCESIPLGQRTRLSAARARSHRA
jgi:hypothetical protein